MQKNKSKSPGTRCKRNHSKEGYGRQYYKVSKKCPGRSGTFQELQYRMLVSHLEDCTYTDRPTSHAHQVRSFL